MLNTMSSTFQNLVRAQDLVRERGDEGWFCNDYSKLREYHNIRDSIEIALANQELLEQYLELAVA